MWEPFDRAPLAHAPGPRTRDDGARRVLPREVFDAAEAEIVTWDGYRPTPLHRLDGLAGAAGLAGVFYKHEGDRFGLGSFKALGGAYATRRVVAAELSRRLGREVPLATLGQGSQTAAAAAITIASATDGNHGRAVAWGAARAGARARIYIHAEVSAGREQALRDLGAEVVRVAGDYDHSVAICRDEAARHGWHVVSDTSWPGYTEPPRDVMAGYGVMAREACRQIGAAPSHVFLQGGVGGLAAAVTAVVRQEWGAGPRIVVVEPDRAACLIASARARRPASVGIEAETIMAGLSCGEPSPLAWQVLQAEVDDFITIPDTTIGPAMRMLAAPCGGDPPVAAGESGVAGLAGALAARRQPDFADRLGLDGAAQILCIGSEGVTDRAIYDWIIAGNDGLPPA